MTTPRIRGPQERDLPELVRIYNHYVTNTHITFDIEDFGVEERRPWFDGFSKSGPHQLLVAELDDVAVGYASSRSFRAKPAYDRSVETTIYLDPAAVGNGLGSRLYGSLLEILHAESEVHCAVGGITLPNPVSVALHERFGFTPVGTFREIGFKFGKYWDVRWYEKDLS